jgi:uncharacterized protein YqeY
MSLISKIKELSLEARKSHDKLRTNLLTSVLGDVQLMAKNDGNREARDADAVLTMKKYLKNIEEVISLYKADQDVLKPYIEEKKVLEELLPKQLNDSELTVIISELKNELNISSQKDMGKMMKVLKERHGGLYDGARASVIVKTLLSG